MNKKLVWYLKAQAGVLLFPLGLCLLGEAVIHKGSGQPWFWLGTLSLVVVNTGVGLMIESGLISGFPRDADVINAPGTKPDLKPE
ncbi:MAG: hypothetical protein DCF22_00245 [Leptolyngbya sp.]|nr:MAG: hypothetical protein DCF22_00245 [Leptolyngbya sp.]